MRASLRLQVFFRCAIAIVTASPVAAQILTRDNYYDYLPPRGRLVSQTSASAQLKLFGDRDSPSYVDRAPTDGIDDARWARLLAIAERFSPIIHPNNFLVPRDPRALLGARQPLMSDLWVNGKRVRSDTIYFEQPADSGVASRANGGQWKNRSDELLSELLAKKGPRSVPSLIVSAEADSDQVLFFDFPGSDRQSWRNAYQHSDPYSGSRILVHPFLEQASESPDDPRYRFVLQYWFFYPFNDAINAHEGDWEHLNIQITTRLRASASATATQALLTEQDARRILSDDYPLDSLVIGELEHYFHGYVVLLDYVELSKPTATGNALVPQDAHYAWEDVGYIRKSIHKRLSVAGGRLATHPLVYIGGDNRGPDELLSLVPRFAGSLKRNSGASYPFPGTWRTVAAADATETAYGTVVPPTKRDASLAWYELMDDKGYLTYRAKDLVLLPDWEMLAPLMETSAEARRAWGWFVLPIYFGFPVSVSPGGGFLMHADVGNIAPMVPTYHGGWNRSGVSMKFLEYRVRVLRSAVSPNTPWTIVQNGWGILNIPFAIWGLMPGYNVGLIELMPWVSGAMHVVGVPPRRTFVTDKLPRRFTSAGSGVFREFGGHEFARLLSGPSSTISTSGFKRLVATGPRFWFNLYFGEHFSLENTYGWSASDMRYAAIDAGGPHQVTGSLEMRQLTGGIRYDLIPLRTESAQFFARAGYGWLWYRAADQRVDGVSLGPSPPHGGYLPPLLPSREWLPNTWYAGGGLEWFAPRRYWWFGLLGSGIRLEYSEYVNRLRYGSAPNRRDVTSFRGDLAASLIFGW